MKVLIAIDSFKGSISSLEAGNAAAEGVRKAIPGAEITVLPIADGGEGTTEALIAGVGGNIREITVTGPIGDKVVARYGIMGNTAIMEMAQASGLTLVPVEKRNPMHTTTYGLGEMILDAIDLGCTDFVIGIGGSATNDGGIGMLQALGFSFLDEHNHEVPYGARGVSLICSISDTNVPVNIKKCNFKIACDVNNPLCGPNGCSAIFAPQKGATEKDIFEMDLALERYSKLCGISLENANPEYPGAGAAGGLGFAFMAFLNASLEPGVSIIFDTIKLEKFIREADIVITGEGRIDAQTIMGKAPIGVAKVSKKYGKRVIGVCGSAAQDASICNEHGIDAVFSIIKTVTSLDEAMEKNNAIENMKFTCEQIFRLLK